MRSHHHEIVASCVFLSLATVRAAWAKPVLFSSATVKGGPLGPAAPAGASAFTGQVPALDARTRHR